MSKDVGSFKTTAVVTKIEREGFNEIQPLGYKIVQELIPKHRIDDWNDEFMAGNTTYVKLDMRSGMKACRWKIEQVTNDIEVHVKQDAG